MSGFMLRFGGVGSLRSLGLGLVLLDIVDVVLGLVWDGLRVRGRVRLFYVCVRVMVRVTSATAIARVMARWRPPNPSRRQGLRFGLVSGLGKTFSSRERSIGSGSEMCDFWTT